MIRLNAIPTGKSEDKASRWGTCPQSSNKTFQANGAPQPCQDFNPPMRQSNKALSAGKSAPILKPTQQKNGELPITSCFPGVQKLRKYQHSLQTSIHQTKYRRATMRCRT